MKSLIYKAVQDDEFIKKVGQLKKSNAKYKENQTIDKAQRNGNHGYQPQCSFQFSIHLQTH
ncbi:hypothetical protein PG593_08005 [Riemerella anatipestifer]|uniref:hypothetical protein n=1 Tax=Riemerella anatipestifer TaxID=34085 RepID=UPI0006997DFD|nr:hypothetical protein [Riemerella anatipestifer]MDY3345249.1 hypothetical protein [Riemerella anatipestifer]MDY3358329.1 hypothetical protein [Riemerella anatipestifer]MDY3529717.1 hypothetical protein [Riemerella anatipestifer]